MKCPTCGRDVPKGWMERHHLRTRRTNKDAIERICRDCHKTLHGLFPHKELRDPQSDLDSLAGLLANERFQKAVSHVKKVPPGAFMRMKESRRRKRSRHR